MKKSPPRMASSTQVRLTGSDRSQNRGSIIPQKDNNMLNILLNLFIIIALISAYIYNDKTGKITEFEHGLWQSFCDVVNYHIRKYERRKHHG